jgi:hypothetical protein
MFGTAADKGIDRSEMSSNHAARRGAELLVGREIAGEDCRAPAAQAPIRGNAGLEEYQVRLASGEIPDPRDPVGIKKIGDQAACDAPGWITAWAFAQHDDLDPIGLRAGECHDSCRVDRVYANRIAAKSRSVDFAQRDTSPDRCRAARGSSRSGMSPSRACGGRHVAWVLDRRLDEDEANLSGSKGCIFHRLAHGRRRNIDVIDATARKRRQGIGPPCPNCKAFRFRRIRGCFSLRDHDRDRARNAFASGGKEPPRGALRHQGCPDGQ